MRRHEISTSIVRRTATILLALAAGSSIATPLAAQAYRARMSSEIANRLAHRVEASSEIIVSTASGTVDTLALRYGVRVKKYIQGGAVLEATGGQIDALTQDPDVAHVAANSIVYRMMAVTAQATGADQVWAGLEHLRGITGRGVGVAVIDSGVFPHPALRDRIVASVDFTGSSTVSKPRDAYGHGTHVAGITAGLGTASGGYYTGVAPGAKLIGIGTGDILFIFWALAGFDYILDHQKAYNIKVVNNSWGTSGPFDPKDPINKASKKVHDKGITVVFAAGNDGPDQNTLNPYSVAPWVIGVAAGCKLVTPDPTNSAVHCADQTGQNRPAWLADFSSRGIPGDNLYHPDITAPGVHIVSTRASTGTVLNALDANHDFDLTSSCAISLANEQYYTCASGTSMATPHVVGVVALMQEAAGGRLTPDKVASVLVQTARPLPGFALWEVGAGYVDALAAVNAVRP